MLISFEKSKAELLEKSKLIFPFFDCLSYSLNLIKVSASIGFKFR